MIPKVIHYCWLSDDPVPQQYQEYIKEWQIIMPEYKIKKWDRNVFNLDEHPFAKAAFEAKKYAFAADYIRVYALYTEGGIYLDSDVKVIRSFDSFLHFGYFTSVENHWSKFNYRLLKGRFIDNNGKRLPDINQVINIGIQAAIVGCEPKHSYISNLWDYYRNSKWALNSPIIAPVVHAKFAELYGFLYIDKLQFLSQNIIIFPSEIFCTTVNNQTTNTFAIHCCAGSWTKKNLGAKGFFKNNKVAIWIYLKYKILFKVQN